ncbi:aminopeptidase N [Azospira restricta]|uniref:Aminopeptidase N n=1 Tax=Azospira restricta TaxID=404405 RepID=A0A974Y3A3_9RHOO|nr:aminopeptidase N [Azospira restricta]QRJ63765.1 aminopeptidase N [Azospira restricta]
MRTDTPQTIRRADYQPLAWTVTDVDLHFALDPAATLVRSRLTLKRNPRAPAGPLVLLGDELELVSLQIDGRTPAAARITDTRIEVDLDGDTATADIVTRIAPAKNTALSGLYTSRGGFFTQCEAEGFRRITWFPDRPDAMARYTVTLEADKASYPVLLSNGNLVGHGELADGRHFARWQDPFPKPSYLFALVAADLAVNERRITTMSGREVLLQIWTETAALERTGHAMESLVRAIRWDEERFGLELDLERFMIVAVSDFNMGAMENKGLNIFNSKLLLATPDTATDVDYESIEAVVAHEYFHNWTGNRVTCRDWFQLTLKEGLTVFRDQEFTADMLAAEGGDSARAVKRIDDVRVLRAAQFPEDAGPMAHPIRPDSYQEINNFYTATVYEKGAEVIRMLQTLLGRDGFRKGMDLYFARHDGQAVTCDDFVAAMADANGRDLTQFLRWYSRPGTPRLSASGRYDAAAQTYTLTLAQRSAGAADEALLIPVAVGLLGADGRDLPLTLAGATAPGTRLLELDAAEQTWTFTGVAERPVLSLLRGFSAPVIADLDEDDATLAFRMAHDGDPFNRWDAAQRFMERTVLGLAADAAAGRPLATPEAFVAAFGALLADDALDPAFHAQALALPGESYLLERMTPADPAALRTALMHLLRDLGKRFAADWLDRHLDCRVAGDYRYHPRDVGLRALGNLCLRYLCAAGELAGFAAAERQFAQAGNMSERLGALGALVHSAAPQRDSALAAFHAHYATDTLVLDKWFALQAGAWRWDPAAAPTLARVRQLLAHPAFAATNPNKVYALLGGYFRANPGEFHSPDGHAFWAEQIVALNAINPQVAARMARALERWRSFTPALQASMRRALETVAASEGLSPDVAEIVGKALA